MSLPIVLSPAAERDIQAAGDWYQGQAGLGLRFVAEVDRALEKIGRMPEAHPVLYRQIRRGRVLKFPYSIFYRVLDSRIEIVAVLHARRDPSVWRSRVEP